MHGYGPREFTLMLLRRMEDFQPALVEAATAELGVTRLERHAAHRRWQAMVRSRGFPSGVRRLSLVLGRPEVERREPYGDLHVVVRRWPLPLWPDLRWQAIATERGTSLHEALVRADGSPGVDASDVTVLAPWSCVVEDVSAAHPHARHLDPGVLSRWHVVVPGPDGVDRRLVFVWGLLHDIGPAVLE